MTKSAWRCSYYVARRPNFQVIDWNIRASYPLKERQCQGYGKTKEIKKKGNRTIVMKKFINVKYEVITLFRTLEHYHVLAVLFFFQFSKE